MQANLRFETGNAEELRKVVGISLESTGQTEYETEVDGGDLVIDIRTEGLGALRGSTDTAFRLVSLAEKLY